MKSWHSYQVRVLSFNQSAVFPGESFLSCRDSSVSLPPEGADREKDGFEIRRNAVETGVNVLTALDTAEALATALEQKAEELTLIDIASL